MIGRRMLTAVALALACGPGTPGETTDEPASTSGASSTTGTTGTTGAATTSGPATSTGEPATTDAATSTGATTTAATTDASSTGPPSDSGVCIADPAAGICSESCDFYSDCCRCDGQKIAIADPQGCTIAAGIVKAECPWNILSVSLDGVSLAEGGSCGAPETQWTQSELGGDIEIELCGDTCAAYLEGKFAELEIGMFCEAA